MDKRIIAACVSVGVIVISAVAGVAVLGRAGMPHKSNIIENKNDNDVTTSAVSTIPVTSVTETVTSVSTAAVSTAVLTTAETAVTTVTEVVTSVSETTTVPETTTVLETTVTETVQPVQTEPTAVETPIPETEPVQPQTERQIIIPDSASEFQREVLMLVNEARASEGKAGLSGSELFNDAANVRAAEISQLFDHTRPDGRDCFSIFADMGLGGGVKGENIAAGTKLPTPADVVNEWLNSPDHRANIMSDDFNTLGIGYFEADDVYKYYWVQLFAS